MLILKKILGFSQRKTYWQAACFFVFYTISFIFTFTAALVLVKRYTSINTESYAYGSFMGEYLIAMQSFYALFTLFVGQQRGYKFNEISVYIFIAVVIAQFAPLYLALLPATYLTVKTPKSIGY